MFSIRNLFKRGTRTRRGDADLARERVDQGIVAESSGLSAEALRCYRSAIDADPAFAPAYLNLGIALQASGESKAAIDAYRQATLLDPGSAAAFYNLALAHLGRGEAALAEAQFLEGLRLRSDFPEAQVGLAEALEALGRNEEALSVLDAAIGLRPDYLPARFNSSVLLRKMGRAEEAETRLRGTDQAALHAFSLQAKRDPENVEALVKLGAARSAAGDATGAIESLQRATDLAPESALALSAMAAALNAAGKPAEAQNYLLRAANADVGCFSAYFEHLLATGQVALAARQFDPVLLKSNPFDRRLMQAHRALVLAQDLETGWFQRALAKSAEGYLIQKEAGPQPVSHGVPTGTGARIALVTFASGPAFEQAQAALNESAIAQGVNRTISWTPAALEATPFYGHCREILSQPRGPGYWLWKPYIILQALLSADDGDWAIYHDTGWTPGAYRFSTGLQPLLEWVASHGDGIFPGVTTNFLKARQWVKRDCFHSMECDKPQFWDVPVVSATWSVWRKSPEAIAFLRAWVALMMDPRLSTDYPSTCGSADLPEFIDHRHDQAVLTLLVHRSGLRYYGTPGHAFFDTPEFWRTSFPAKDINAFIATVASRQPGKA